MGRTREVPTSMAGARGHAKRRVSRRRVTAVRVLAVACAVAVASLMLAVSPPGARATEVLPAGAGEALELQASTVAGTGEYSRISTIVLVEGAPGDFAPGQSEATLVLRAPAGFEFEPGRGLVFRLPGDVTAAGLAVAAEQLTITFSTAPTAQNLDLLVVVGLRVRPTTGTPASGQIFRPSTGGGSAVIVDIVPTDNEDGAGGTTFGLLASVTAP